MFRDFVAFWWNSRRFFAKNEAMESSRDTPASSSETLRFIAKGASADIFLMEEGTIFKLFRDSVSDDMIEREADASIHAHACGVPTAAAMALRQWDGRRGIIYPWLQGQTVMDWIRQNPMRAGWALDRMGAVHAVVHQAEGTGLRSLKQVLATDISYGPASVALQREAIAYLNTLPDGHALLHGDFHMGNAMLTPKGVMLIDWSKATSGHPAADVVRSEMLMRFGIGATGWVTNLWRDWAAERLRKASLASSAVTTSDLDQWRPVVALAWLRARNAGRTPAFLRYVRKALEQAGLLTPL